MPGILMDGYEELNEAKPHPNLGLLSNYCLKLIDVYSIKLPKRAMDDLHLVPECDRDSFIQQWVTTLLEARYCTYMCKELSRFDENNNCLFLL